MYYIVCGRFIHIIFYIQCDPIVILYLHNVRTLQLYTLCAHVLDVIEAAWLGSYLLAVDRDEGIN